MGAARWQDRLTEKITYESLLVIAAALVYFCRLLFLSDMQALMLNVVRLFLIIHVVYSARSRHADDCTIKRSSVSSAKRKHSVSH